MEDLPIPPFYIAVVAILFLRWLIGRAKRAAELREQMRNQRKGGAQPTPPPRQPPPSQPTQTRPTQTSRQAESPRPEEPPRPAQSVPETLQELFEMRRQAIAEAQRAASKPPPIPVQEVVKEEVPEIEPIVVVPSKPIQIKPSRGIRKTSSIVKTFSDRDQIRNAVILKEVLDKPKGFDL